MQDSAGAETTARSESYIEVAANVAHVPAVTVVDVPVPEAVQPGESTGMIPQQSHDSHMRQSTTNELLAHEELSLSWHNIG